MNLPPIISAQRYLFPNGKTALLHQMDGIDLCPVCGNSVGDTFWVGDSQHLPDGTLRLPCGNSSGSFDICSVCGVEYGFDCFFSQDDIIDGATDLHNWRRTRRALLHRVGRTPDLFDMLKRIGAIPDFDAVEPSDEAPFAIHAAAAGDLQKLAAMTSTQAQACDWDGWTPLHWAAAMGHVQAVPLLLAAGANPAAVNERGETPLMWAAWTGNTQAAQFLLNAGADPAARTTLGRVALDCQWTDSAIARSPAGQTAVHWAAENGGPSVTHALLHWAAPRDSVDDGLVTPLMVCRDARSASLLIQSGADVSRTDARGFDALMLAARQARHAIIAPLVAAGANPNAQTPLQIGHTVLTLAIEEGRWDKNIQATVEALLAAGADVNQPAADGMFPLEYAPRRGVVAVVARLLAAGAQVNARGYAKNAALHAALSNYKSGPPIEMVELLLRAGADPNLPGEGDASPLMVAAKWQGVPTIDLLIASGARIDQRDRRLRTALHYAAECGSADVLARLLAAAADPTATDNLGRTPYTVASDPQKRKMLKEAHPPAAHGG